MTQKNIDTALILVPTKNRNYEIQRCLNSLKGDVEKSEKLNYALVVVIDDSTKTAIREKNRKVCEKIRSDIFKVFYFGLNEQFSLFNELKFYFENAKISPYEFTRTLGKDEWDLASVRNLSLIICRLLGATTDLIYLSDDDIIFPETIENSILRNDMANDRFSSLLDSFIYVFEEDNAKAVGALIEGDFDLSIFYQIDYAINRTKNFLLWAKNRNPEDNCKMYFWNEGRTGLEEYTNIGTTFIRICNMIKEIKERSPSIYRMGRKKFSLSTKDNKIRFMKSTTLSGGSMCISYDSIESHPFMHAYNEDWIWLRVLNPKNDGSTLQANIMTIQKPMKRDVASIKNIVRQQIGEILKEYIDQFAQRIKKPFSECTLDKEDIQMLVLMRDKVLGKMVKLEKKSMTFLRC